MKKLLFILPLLLWVGCEDDSGDTNIDENNDNDGTPTIIPPDPVNLHPQNKIYKHHLRVNWDLSDSSDMYYNVIMAKDSLFTNVVQEKSIFANFIYDNTNTTFDRLYDDALIASDDGQGWKYFVKVVISDSIESNIEVHQTSRAVGIVYIPYDAYSGNAAFDRALEGDTIIFPEGEHTYNVGVGGMNYVLIGDGNAKDVILQGNLTGCSVSLFNLTMSNGGSFSTSIAAHGTIQEHLAATNVIFRDANSDYSIYLNNYKSAFFKNCIFYNNSPKNLHLYQNATFENCTFHNVTDPISLSPAGDPNSPDNGPVTIINCLFTEISGEVINYLYFGSIPNFVSVTYSGFDNTPLMVSGTGNITSNPDYVDSGNSDFHLLGTSGFIDAGNPDAQYNDVDGTRNDMGAYGGPNGGW
jgi:hypothetical protein